MGEKEDNTVPTGRDWLNLPPNSSWTAPRHGTLKPDNTGYRLNKASRIGTVLGFLCALPFTFTANWLFFWICFPVLGGVIGWAVEFLRIGGEVD